MTCHTEIRLQNGWRTVNGSDATGHGSGPRSNRQQVLAFPVPSDPVGELVAWSRDVLKVPVGHPLAGEPMTLPAFAVDFLRAGWNAHESALEHREEERQERQSARCWRSASSSGRCVNPAGAAPWRASAKEKAGELRGQIEAIAKASGLEGLTFRASVRIPARSCPNPGLAGSPVVSDRTAGHSSSSFDLGNHRRDRTHAGAELARTARRAFARACRAKNGRTVHISVRGDSPLYAEVLSNPAVVSHVYEAPEGCELDDVDAWRAANPGLGTA